MIQATKAMMDSTATRVGAAGLDTAAYSSQEDNGMPNRNTAASRKNQALHLAFNLLAAFNVGVLVALLALRHNSSPTATMIWLVTPSTLIQSLLLITILVRAARGQR